MARRAVVVAVLGLELLGLGAGFMLPPSTPQHACIRPASTSGEPLTVMKAGSFKLSSLATLQGLQSAASVSACRGGLMHGLVGGTSCSQSRDVLVAARVG